MDKEHQAIERMRADAKALKEAGQGVPLEVEHFLATHPEQTLPALLIAEMERHTKAVMSILGFEDDHPTPGPSGAAERG
jgi:hypothetical protein